MNLVNNSNVPIFKPIIGLPVIIHPRVIVSNVPMILQLIAFSMLLNLVTFILLLYLIVTDFGFASSANGAYK